MASKTVRIKKDFQIGQGPRQFKADEEIQNCSDPVLLTLAKQGVVAEFVKPEAQAPGVQVESGGDN